MHAEAYSARTENHDRILDAAIERFRYYGYGKTAMAEVAGDVEMSTANLYRYFKNKEDIAVACVIRCLNERHALLASVVQQPQMAADDKLRQFFHAILEYTYEQVSSRPKLNQLVELITDRHTHIVYDKNSIEQSLIRQILEQGQREGLFAFDDINQAALAVHNSMHLFQLPMSMNLYKLETFREMITATVNLLLHGLYQR